MSTPDSFCLGLKHFSLKRSWRREEKPKMTSESFLVVFVFAFLTSDRAKSKQTCNCTCDLWPHLELSPQRSDGCCQQSMQRQSGRNTKLQYSYSTEEFPYMLSATTLQLSVVYCSVSVGNTHVLSTKGCYLLRNTWRQPEKIHQQSQTLEIWLDTGSCLTTFTNVRSPMVTHARDASVASVPCTRSHFFPPCGIVTERHRSGRL